MVIWSNLNNSCSEMLSSLLFFGEFISLNLFSLFIILVEWEILGKYESKVLFSHSYRFSILITSSFSKKGIFIQKKEF